MDTGIFDHYELRAAYIPAMIILLPIPLALLSVFQVDDFPLKGTVVWTLTVFITLLFAIAMAVRYCGQNYGFKRKETKEELDDRLNRDPTTTEIKRKRVEFSKPSTEYLRRCDDNFELSTKMKISDRCQALFDIRLKLNGAVTEQDEHNAKVFNRMQDYLYKEDPDGLWHKQQTLSHYARNLNGSRYLFAIVGLGSLLVSGLYISIKQKVFPGRIFIINIGYVIAVCIYICLVIPYSMRHYAELFASEAITTFLILTPAPEKPGKEGK